MSEFANNFEAMGIPYETPTFEEWLEAEIKAGRLTGHEESCDIEERYYGATGQL